MLSCSVARLVALIAVSCLLCVVVGTPLDDYVKQPDPTFAWKLVSTVPGDGYYLYNIFLTSQTWLTAQDTDTPVWTHWLQVCVPYSVDMHNHVGLIYVDGGHTPNINSPPTKSLNPIVDGLCVSGRTVAAELSAIPNEPVVFAGDPTHSRRSEDSFIAYTWNHFIKHPDQPYWLARMPMTKAVVRAMDAIQQFVQTYDNFFVRPPPVTNFMIAGGSKRGWTTWTVGAVDRRVAAIVPIVAPVLRLTESLEIMWQAYGNWSFALQDYVDMGITPYLRDDIFRQLMSIVGPEAYVDRYVMPKLVICAAGDEFFMPDAASLFWNMLKGEKYFRIVPNAEHSLAGHVIDVATNIQSFFVAVTKDYQRPNYNWTVDEKSGSITVQIAPNSLPPKKVIMFHAHAPTKRDFRLITCDNLQNPDCINPVFWFPKELQDAGNGMYVASMPVPSTGYTGFFVEIEFRIGGLSSVDPFKVTTSVSILPTKLPYPPCNCNECGGPNCPPHL